MFKTMTRTLSIPHFLFSDTYDITDLSHLRSSLNTSLSSDPTSTIKKLSYLPFIIKAVSTALHSYPILNARLDTSGPKPTLTYRAAHNIGIAIDTPGGLLVPVIKSVHTLSILEIAAEVTRLSSLAEASKLSTNDFSNGTITVSNIGSIGGTTVAPVIVDGQLSILGIGKVRTVPAFDSQEDIVRRQEVVCSWSADHRVVDGATMARFAGKVGEFLSAPGRLVVNLR
jgi:2-oxoisovalerate dehydrogenase E2 component (dihydrolipoyl transacylase)